MKPTPNVVRADSQYPHRVISINKSFSDTGQWACIRRRLNSNKIKSDWTSSKKRIINSTVHADNIYLNPTINIYFLFDFFFIERNVNSLFQWNSLWSCSKNLSYWKSVLRKNKDLLKIFTTVFANFITFEQIKLNPRHQKTTFAQL